VDLYILDDGYQHLAIERDANSSSWTPAIPSAASASAARPAP
jgi:hypothetical protein